MHCKLLYMRLVVATFELVIYWLSMKWLIYALPQSDSVFNELNINKINRQQNGRSARGRRAQANKRVRNQIELNCLT